MNVEFVCLSEAHREADPLINVNRQTCVGLFVCVCVGDEWVCLSV